MPGVSNGGRLRDSLKIGITTQRGRKVIRIFSNATNSRGQDYARYVIRGTVPHVINGNPNLRFEWIGRGAFVITPTVNHPGTQPNNFLLQALQVGFNR